MLPEAPNNPLLQPYRESWYGFNIWSCIFIAVLLDLNGLTVEHGHGTYRRAATALSLPYETTITSMVGLKIEDWKSIASAGKSGEWVHDNSKHPKTLRDMLTQPEKLGNRDPKTRLRIRDVRISTAGFPVRYTQLRHLVVGVLEMVVLVQQYIKVSLGAYWPRNHCGVRRFLIKDCSHQGSEWSAEDWTGPLVRSEVKSSLVVEVRATWTVRIMGLTRPDKQ
ncbi:hypothetical protein HOY82DRAFT_600571 [Tuber indicum]|nr:hypothetical protein HOY82DRAFT_600571 [Tuber indicum]